METAEYKNMFDVEKTHWWFISRQKFIAAMFSTIGLRPGKRLRIVDIGAGTGGMITFLRRYGSVTGVEPNDEGRRLAKTRAISLHIGKAEKTGLESGAYDVVCFFDVLYHQNIDETRALREAWRLLKPGGRLVVTDCAFPFLTSPNDDRVMGKTRFTLSTMRILVEKSGFAVAHGTYTFFLVFPLVALWRIVQKVYWSIRRTRSSHSDMRPLPGWFNTIMGMLCAIESIGHGRLGYPWGSSLILVATK